MSHSLRVIFAGTPEFAAAALAAIHSAGFPVPLVLTQPDRPAGRGMKLQASPVKRYAQEHGLAVAQPPSLRRTGKYPAEATAAIDQLRATPHDVMVVAAYGLILPQSVLTIPPHGCINIHGSLLPRWRGAAPIQRAVMAGDSETGVMSMRMAEGLDTGAVLLSERTMIGRKTYGELENELSRLGAGLMVRTLAALERGSLVEQPQSSDGATYAKKISKEETRIDWSKSAREIDCQIRGLSPAPGAWTEMKGERVKVLNCEPAEASGTPGTLLDDVLTVACGSGAVRLTRLQRPGKAAMEAREVLRGFALPSGSKLS